MASKAFPQVIANPHSSGGQNADRHEPLNEKQKHRVDSLRGQVQKEVSQITSQEKLETQLVGQVCRVQVTSLVVRIEFGIDDHR